ncbi:MAG TPA: VIT domain-containing protein [Polyangiaceae bacterium]|nr:VIT domain-containing protein [Polyangiaceae bacterium]
MIWLSIWLLPSTAHARDDGPPASERTLAPYFFLEGGDPKLDSFPLQDTRVDVNIAGVLAHVTVTQRYENRGQRPIHAEYVFPASTRAAVHGLSMQIRDQRIVAKIQERKAAERTFEVAKQAKKNASLLTQERPNVFTLKVANIQPKDVIEVELRYSELLVPEAGTYEFVFPTVVGPRYANGAAKPSESQFVASPFLPKGQAAPQALRISGVVSAGLPIRDLSSPSHVLSAQGAPAGASSFQLAPSAEPPNNRDFVLRYRLAGDAIQSGLMLYDGGPGQEKFFALQVEPPQRVPSELVPPREYVFVLDVSGSMQGFPLDTAKQLMRNLVSELRPQDRFNVLLFSGGSELLSEHSLPGTPANLALAQRFVDTQNGGGGTELLPALERAFALSKNEGLSRSFIVVTDGYIEQDRHAIELVRRRLSDANVFAFGVGTSVNRYLIEGLAKAASGEPFVVLSPAESEKQAKRFYEYVRAPVLTDVHVRFDGFDAYDVEPSAVPDVLAARPVLIQGKWRGNAKGAIEVTGLSGQGTFRQRFDVQQVVPRSEHQALSYAWARARIASLSDFGFAEPSEAARGQITQLGLRYELLTRYTAFVAVAERVRNASEPAQNVKQPSPLPLGVNNSALPSETNSADEPELLWMLLIAALVIGGAALQRRQVSPRGQTGEPA